MRIVKCYSCMFWVTSTVFSSVLTDAAATVKLVCWHLDQTTNVNFPLFSEHVHSCLSPRTVSLPLLLIPKNILYLSYFGGGKCPNIKLSKSISQVIYLLVQEKLSPVFEYYNMLPRLNALSGLTRPLHSKHLLSLANHLVYKTKTYKKLIYYLLYK